MRTIKFRAKRPDDGKWVFGDYKHHQKVTKTGLEPTILVDNDPVILETIGQFTGLLDKNGKEIYEGDIVMWGHLNDGWSNETPHRKAIVKLFPTLHFLAFTETEFGTPHAFYYDSFAYKDTQKYLEVIGNEFDNYELLKGGKE